MDKNIIKLDASNDKSGKYEVETIWDNAVYARELKLSYLPEFYYLLSFKGYSDKKNI